MTSNIMYTCDDCRDRLWDYLYGLLEAEECQGLRGHLAACAACQAALEKAETHRHLLAEAARLDVPVPLFVPPSEEVLSRQANGAHPTILRAFRLRTAIAAAAALLLGIVSAFALYERGLAYHQADVAEAQQQIETFHSTNEKQQQEILAEEDRLRSRQLRIQVMGTASYHRDGSSHFRIITADLEGRSTEARVGARLVDANDRILFEKRDLVSSGNVLVSLPPDLSIEARSSARLQVWAEGPGGREEVSGSLQMNEVPYLTHIVTDKPHYRPGERVYFRSLTLDQVRLQPPPEEVDFIVKYVLTNAAGASVGAPLSGRLLRGGLGGGDFSLPRKLSEGEYTLTVFDSEQRFQPQSLKVRVQRDPVGQLHKTLQLARSSYRPGDLVQAVLRATRVKGGDAAANLDVSAKLEVNGQAVGAAQELRTDVTGAAALRVELPGELGSGDVRLRVSVAGETLVRTVPVEIPGRRVEFFPEGGDLIAGVANRVYYRVRTPLGQPADLEGVIQDSQGQPVTRVQTAPANGPSKLTQGLGVCSFVPQAGETYSLRITSPLDLPVSTVALPPVQTSGLVLSVPHSVVRETEPIEITLRQGGLLGRPLVVAATCRGRLLAEETVAVVASETQVRLLPRHSMQGVVRVTAFDASGARLIPVAERLVYRVPARRLSLAVEAEKKEGPVGDRVELKLRSLDETGQPESAWLMVAVVNRQTLERVEDPQERGLGAHFYLTTEVHGPRDLEWTEFLLSDNVQARAALDLFLATHGWRHFVHRESADLLAAKHPAGQETPGAALVKFDNLDSVRQAYLQAHGELEERALARAEQQQEEASQLTQNANRAAAGLRAYQARALTYLRLGLGSAAIALLAFSCVLLTTAIVRILRGETSTRPNFRAVLATLPLGALLIFVLSTGVLGLLTPPVPDVKAMAVVPLPQPLTVSGDASSVAVAREYAPAAPARPWQGESSLARRNDDSSAPNLLIGSGHQRRPNAPLPAKEYVHRIPKDRQPGDLSAPDTLLWHPVLFAQNGTAQVAFDLPHGSGSYRIMVQGHGNTGRLGLYQGQLEARPPVPAPAR